MILCRVTCLILTIFSLENTSYIFSTESKNYNLEAGIKVTRNDNKFVKTRHVTWQWTQRIIELQWRIYLVAICMERRIPRSRAYKIFHNNFSYRIWQLSYFYQMKYTPHIKTYSTNANQLSLLIFIYNEVFFGFTRQKGSFVQNIYCPKLYNYSNVYTMSNILHTHQIYLNFEA